MFAYARHASDRKVSGSSRSDGLDRRAYSALQDLPLAELRWDEFSGRAECVAGKSVTATSEAGSGWNSTLS